MPRTTPHLRHFSGMTKVRENGAARAAVGPPLVVLGRAQLERSLVGEDHALGCHASAMSCSASALKSKTLEAEVPERLEHDPGKLDPGRRPVGAPVVVGMRCRQGDPGRAA
mgnify:CR=1 FL=1